MKRHRGSKIVLCILAGLAIAAAVVVVVMLLWNWLVPVLFNGPEITFWQALGLFILVKLLVGGFRSKGKRCRNNWKNRMDRMTPEERERFKQKFMCKWERGD